MRKGCNCVRNDKTNKLKDIRCIHILSLSKPRLGISIIYNLIYRINVLSFKGISQILAFLCRNNFFFILYLHFLTSDTQCDQGITDRNKDCIQSQISYVFHGNIYLSDFNIKLNVLLLVCDAIQI